ncbi:uncharacterized protein LOC142804173 isoform X1 [Rhipicephalus microplus]|uniref:uncharacterized protein LOC142804173 isoform X1 n=1 Tax=Rhipicephalus microplus TaxID=6941 RepID=UPI003F6D09DD
MDFNVPATYFGRIISKQTCQNHAWLLRLRVKQPNGIWESIFCIPTGKNYQQQRLAWLHRISRKNFVSSKNTGLCELTPGLDYDCTTSSGIGHSTLASSDPSASAGLATHALVFMLGGVMSRWKQAVAYHFSADFFDAKQVLAILIRKSEATGLSVDCNF